MGLIKNYLCSTQTFASQKEAMLSIALFILWWVVVLIGINFHEYWRDEVRALTIALESETIFGIFSALKGEGHPAAWYFLLRICHTVVNSYLTLPVVSTGVAFAGIVVLFCFAPFPNWQKILFIFGMFPIYEYSVIATNFGLVMLLVFCFAHFYRNRQEKPLVLSFLLFVLANTGAHALLITAVLSFVWFVDYLVSDRKKLALHLGSFGLVVLAGVIAIFTAMPGSGSWASFIYLLEFREFISALFKTILHPGQHYGAIFPGVSLFIRDLIFWVLVAGLCTKPMRAVALVLGAILLGMFVELVYAASARHQGSFFSLRSLCTGLPWLKGNIQPPFVSKFPAGCSLLALAGSLRFIFLLGGKQFGLR